MKLTELIEVKETGVEFGNPSWSITAKAETGQTVKATRFLSHTKPGMRVAQDWAERWPESFEVQP